MSTRTSKTQKNWDVQLWSARREVRRALCCGAAGVRARCLCCFCLSAGCNGLSNGSLFFFFFPSEKWAGVSVWHSRSHYASLEDQPSWESFSRRGSTSSSPCVREEGLLARAKKTVWQLDSELRGCLLREIHLKTEGVNHSGTTGSLCSGVWGPVRERRLFLAEKTKRLCVCFYVGLILPADCECKSARKVLNQVQIRLNKPDRVLSNTDRLLPVSP